MLVAVSDFVLLLVFPFLVPIRFGLSQQVACGKRFSGHNGLGRKEGGIGSMKDGLVVEEAAEQEVEVQEERYSSDATVGRRALFVLARGNGSTKGHQKG